ncbi:hypothetical protein B0H11DRAFT_1907561 [Mycena galericulata]|nr:hypothetical protein B0H11DRAFT_1907561 [Mycena galericulata]
MSDRFKKDGVGFDPIIGNANRWGAAGGAERPVNGLDPTEPARNFTLSTGEPISLEFLVPRSYSVSMQISWSRGTGNSPRNFTLLHILYGNFWCYQSALDHTRTVEWPPEPKLPQELEHIIFELAALSHPNGIPTLLRTAWRVKEWYYVWFTHGTIQQIFSGWNVSCTVSSFRPPASRSLSAEWTPSPWFRPKSLTR